MADRVSTSSLLGLDARAYCECGEYDDACHMCTVVHHMVAALLGSLRSGPSCLNLSLCLEGKPPDLCRPAEVEAVATAGPTFAASFCQIGLQS